MPLEPLLKQRLMDLVGAELEALNVLYRHLHAHPELSGREVQTAAYLAERMRCLGLVVHTGLGGHGLAGVMENGPGPTVLLRADMDALPLKECTGLPFASTAEADLHEQSAGVMHACGHDVHMTCLVGAATVLRSLQPWFGGRVIFVAQPDEEVQGGARLMMAEGLYGKTGRPDWCIALHVKPDLAAGFVGLAPGVRSSAAQALDIAIRGRGGHGAAPHQATDPVVLAAQFVLALQSIVSREIDPAKMGLITVGAIHGGTKRNIIPDRVDLNMTVRAYEEEVRDRIVSAVVRTAKGLAQSRRGETRLVPLHDPGFYPDMEKCLPTGVATLAGAVLALLSPPGGSGMKRSET